MGNFINQNIKSLDKLRRSDWRSFAHYLRSFSLKEFRRHEPVFKKLLGLKPLQSPQKSGFHYEPSYSGFETTTSVLRSSHYFEYTPPTLIKQMFERVTLKQQASFLDIGSGNGIVNMVAGLMQPALRKNIGIELHEGLVEKSRIFVTKTKYPHPIQFIYEDFFRNPELFSEIDVTYHYMNLRDERGILTLLDLWKKNAKSGAILILNDIEENLNFYREIKKVFLEVMTDKSYQNYPHYLYIFTKR